MPSLAHVTGLLPGAPVAVPLLGAALLSAFRKWLSRAAMDSAAIFFVALNLLTASLLLTRASHGAFTYWFGNWYPRGSMVLGISFVVEPIGAGLATLAALLTVLALVFSWRFVDCGQGHYQPLMLVFLAAMSGFVLTGDLFNMFVFFELMSTAAFALCGLKTAEPSPLQGSLNFAVTNTVAAFLVLTGIALLYAMTGALNMAQIGLSLGAGGGARHDPLVLFAFTLLTCGFLVKGAIAPFHLWLPDAHAVAPTPVCVLFSGIMVELGLYAIVRLHTTIFAQCLAWHPLAARGMLYAFAAVTVVLGGIMCYAEHHLKRLLAFSTICHAGLMLLTFSIGGPLAIAAMLLYLLAHALIKGGLFFVTGMLLHRLRTVTERQLYRRGRELPWVGLLWFLGAAGLAGVPGSALLLATAGAEHAAERNGVHGVSALFFFGGMMTAAAVLRTGMSTFLGWGDGPLTDAAAEVGERPEDGARDTKIYPFHFLPAAFCVLAGIALSFLPGWLPVLRDAAAVLASQPAYLHTVYAGQGVPLTQPGWREAVPSAALHSTVALMAAFALACTSVFRNRLQRRLRLGPFLEGRLRPLRAFQSGHPGDYVAWLTVGLAVFGSAAVLLLRR